MDNLFVRIFSRMDIIVPCTCGLLVIGFFAINISIGKFNYEMNKAKEARLKESIREWGLQRERQVVEIPIKSIKGELTYKEAWNFSDWHRISEFSEVSVICYDRLLRDIGRTQQLVNKLVHAQRLYEFQLPDDLHILNHVALNDILVRLACQNHPSSEIAFQDISYLLELSTHSSHDRGDYKAAANSYSKEVRDYELSLSLLRSISKYDDIKKKLFTRLHLEDQDAPYVLFALLAVGYEPAIKIIPDVLERYPQYLKFIAGSTIAEHAKNKLEFEPKFSLEYYPGFSLELNVWNRLPASQIFERAICYLEICNSIPEEDYRYIGAGLAYLFSHWIWDGQLSPDQITNLQNYKNVLVSSYFGSMQYDLGSETREGGSWREVTEYKLGNFIHAPVEDNIIIL